jgi:hypothetical protein
MKSTQKQAINNLNNLLQNIPVRGDFAQQIKSNVDILANGLNSLDQEVKQKDQKVGELQKTLLDKEQKEWVKVLHQRFPHDYPANFNEWSNNSWGKDVVNRKDLQAIENHLPTFKVDVLKNKFIEVLQQRFPHDYSTNFNEWPNIWGKDVINRGDIEAMEKWIPIYEKEIKENLKQLVLSKNSLLVQKDNLINQKTIELQSKDNLLLQKELEKQELVRLKEIEKEELLAQKEKEIHNKSLVKNQVISELQSDIDFKEKEAYKLQIELLKKQLEFKDKALEAALEIGKQNKIINELQGKLLAVVDLHKEGRDIPDIEVLKSQVNESILSGNVDDMKEFSKYLSELMKNPIEKDESLEISELLNNLSPVLHVQENLVQNPLAVINNFDINNVHTTHSVLISGEESSFDII